MVDPKQACNSGVGSATDHFRIETHDRRTTSFDFVIAKPERRKNRQANVVARTAEADGGHARVDRLDFCPGGEILV